MDVRNRTMTRFAQAVLAGLGIVLVLVALAGCGGEGESGQTPQPDRGGMPATQVASKSGLPVIFYQDLPKQAKETIQLIDQGGPFPFSRDGITFQNREQLLPKKPNGYYSEYTVITPGSSDRGARRIIAGENGELYYTDDHYESFREVIR